MIFYVKLKILYIYSNVEYANFSSLLVFFQQVEKSYTTFNIHLNNFRKDAKSEKSNQLANNSMNLTTILKDTQSLLPLGKYRNKTNEETKNV